MPSAYTDAIKDGITFEQFAMRCARAMGALVDMRDLPMDAPVPERFEPSDYHLRKLEVARQNLHGLETMALYEVDLVASLAFMSSEEERLVSLERNTKMVAAYNAMLDQVDQWTPPSDDHQRFKDFMREQIVGSLKWDDNSEYLSTPTAHLTGQEYLEKKKTQALADIEYHKTKHAEEVARTEQRNTWLRLLRESLAVQS